MDRRTLLTATGAALFTPALSGCASTRQSAGSTYGMGETASVAGRQVTVSDPVLHRDIVTGSNDDGRLRVVRNPSAQWLVVTVAVEGGTDRPAPASRLGVSYGGATPDVRPPLVAGATDRVGVPVPAEELSAVSVLWSTDKEPVRWRVPERILERTGSLPAFEAERFDVPATVQPGDPVPVAIAVHDTGKRADRSTALLDAERQPSTSLLGGSVLLARRVEVAGTASLERRLRPSYGGIEGEFDVALETGDERRTATVSVTS